MSVQRQIESRLQGFLKPLFLEIQDQSAAHAGHAGARAGGETHFAVAVVTTAFEGKKRIERHRMVTEPLSDLLRTQIHALSITALTPDEAAARTGGA